MKKFYMSALVTGLLIQPIWAEDIDSGTVPAVEVEVVEVEAVGGDEVDRGAPDAVEIEITDGETQTLEAPVEGEFDPAVCDKGPAVGAGEFVDPAVCFINEDGTTTDGAIDENGELIEPVVCYFGGVGNIPADENGEVIDPAIDFTGDGEVVNGETFEGEVVECEVTIGREVVLFNSVGEMPSEEATPTGESEEPVQNLTDEEAIDLASQSGVSRGGDGETQPYFRTLTAGGASESADSVAEVGSEIEQVANEQRAPVRLFEKAEDTVAPVKRGLSRLFGKKTAPKAATSADKSLAQKLAEVDQLRDKALATRNSKLLAHADKLEAQIRHGQKGMKTMAPKK